MMGMSIRQYPRTPVFYKSDDMPDPDEQPNEVAPLHQD